jgi:hypothetical protein
MGVENNGGVRGGGGSRRAGHLRICFLFWFFNHYFKNGFGETFFSLNLFLFNHVNPSVTNYEGVMR